MISKEEFITLINEHKKWNDRITQVCDVLDIDMFEEDWINYTYSLFESTLDFLFTDSAVETITWWLYEKGSNPSLEMYDNEGNEIPTDTVEDLWNYVKQYLRE